MAIWYISLAYWLEIINLGQTEKIIFASWQKASRVSHSAILYMLFRVNAFPKTNETGFHMSHLSRVFNKSQQTLTQTEFTIDFKYL